ncbi:MAG: DUF3012 domain-containing protein [Zetaproteobacteria bacterium CG_4_9_14_3_um_filter_53_7]|nr:MAG: DUF3012 domain-containing protein [Zetaproteobacteria bacterium CG_4_9_14_3_um_filter_53_7]
MKKMFALMFAALIVLSFSGCSEPGSKAWCENMKDKPKGEWSANDAKTFTQHCVLGNYVE